MKWKTPLTYVIVTTSSMNGNHPSTTSDVITKSVEANTRTVSNMYSNDQNDIQHDIWDQFINLDPKSRTQMQGTLKDLYSTFVNHPLSKETQYEINNNRFIWKEQRTQLPMVKKYIPMVKTYGAIEHMLNILEHLHGKDAPLEQDMTIPVLFFNTLLWIKTNMGLMTNEDLIITLQNIHHTLLSIIDKTDHKTPSIPRFIRRLLPKGKLFVKNIEEQCNSVLWGIRIVHMFDVIEKRQARTEMRKRFPTKTVLVPSKGEFGQRA